MPAVGLVAGVANFGKRMSNARLFQPMHAFPESLFDDFSFERSEIFVFARPRQFECDLDNMGQAPIVLGQCGLPNPLLSATYGQHIGADKAAAKDRTPPPCGYRGQPLSRRYHRASFPSRPSSTPAAPRDCPSPSSGRWSASTRRREATGREASPTAAIINSRSAKAAQKGAPRSTRWGSMRARRSQAASAIEARVRSGR
jgi:hypothetical protein